MKKELGLVLFVMAIAVVIGYTSIGYTEDVTILTYYPAPYGIYKNLKTTKDTWLATDSGRVGIGTTVPGALLDVQGAAQFGTGNVNLIDSAGKITGISSTYFASLNGSALTDLNASNLASGTVPSGRIVGVYTEITGVGTLTSLSVSGTSKFGNDISLASNKTVDGCDISIYSPYFINSPGTSGYVWTSDGSGTGTWQAVAAGGATTFLALNDTPSTYFGSAGKCVKVSSTNSLVFSDDLTGGGVQGSGTVGYIPKFTTNNKIGDSVIYESGGNVGIGTASPGSYKLRVTGGTYGISADGSTLGGYFGDTDGTSYSYLAFGTCGVQAYGREKGGYFEDTNGTSNVSLGYGDYGIKAYGNSCGGYFKDSNSSGEAYLANQDYGIQAYGSTMGGHFKDTDASSGIYLAFDNYGIFQYNGTKNYFIGDVGIGKPFPTAKLHVNGNIKAVLNDISGFNLITYNLTTKEIGYDIAELFGTNGEVEPGDVLVIDSDGKLKKSDKEYDKKVAGIVSSAPAILFEGRELQIAPEPFKFQKGTKPPVTLAGKVSTKVTTENGAIEPGDLLTTSSTPGYAMKAKPVVEINGYTIYPQGCIVGKALEGIKESKGKILVLVCLM